MFVFFSVSSVSANTLTSDRNYLIEIGTLYGELDIAKCHPFDLPHEIPLTADAHGLLHRCGDALGGAEKDARSEAVEGVSRSGYGEPRTGQGSQASS